MSLTIELSPDAEAALKRRAESHGMSVEDYARERLSATEIETAAPPPPTDAEERPIWDKIVDNMEGVSEEEAKKFPRDGAAQVDHYLYGRPKR